MLKISLFTFEIVSQSKVGRFLCESRDLSNSCQFQFPLSPLFIRISQTTISLFCVGDIWKIVIVKYQFFVKRDLVFFQFLDFHFGILGFHSKRTKKYAKVLKCTFCTDSVERRNYGKISLSRITFSLVLSPFPTFANTGEKKVQETTGQWNQYATGKHLDAP